MLKLLPILLAAAQPASESPCVSFEIWKGGDDGLTNRVFDQLDTFNQAKKDCEKSKACEKRYMVIPTNVSGVEGEEGKTLVPVEIYRDIADPSTLIERYSVVCDLTKNDCAQKVFGHKPSK